MLCIVLNDMQFAPADAIITTPPPRHAGGSLERAGLWWAALEYDKAARGFVKISIEWVARR
jgi:hypothetical protein